MASKMAAKMLKQIYGRVDIPPHPKKIWRKVYNSFSSYWTYSEWQSIKIWPLKKDENSKMAAIGRENR